MNSREDKRKRLIEFIKKNPHTTYKEIRQKTKLRPERIFKNGLKEAFKEAQVKAPRNFNRKTKEERKKVIIDYIRKHPKAGGHTIAKDTKINLASAFKNIEDVYREAGIKYPRNVDWRTREEKKEEIIKMVKENPLINTSELAFKTKTQPYKFFKNIDEIYKKAGVQKIRGHSKRLIKKQQLVIQFIQDNPLATQREINNSCNTHVQELFKEGIFEAYKKAKIKFPYERLKLYGVGLKEVRKRAKTFEEEISVKLSGYGKVNRLVRTKRGIADIVFERKNKKIIIEIKDYQNKDISKSQIKQLNKYLEDCNCALGILICHKKPKKDKFLIGENKIIVLEKDELSKIPKLIKG